MPLWGLVLMGIGGSILILVLLGWYFANQEYLQGCGTGCASWWWFPPLESDSMFAVVRNTVTAAAALGLGVTIVLSYRRQRVAEQTLTYTAETQRLAVQAQELAADRLDRESLDTLRTRYLEIATLLNSGGDLNRITALHALESLTLSWRQFGNDMEASAAVGLLLSTARLVPQDTAPGREFRQGTTRVLDRHFKADPGTAYGWGSLTVDATGCLSSKSISDWIVDGGNLTASAEAKRHLQVSGLTIRDGDVFLKSTGPASKSDDDTAHTLTVERMVIDKGMVRIASTDNRAQYIMVVSDSVFNGGTVVFSGVLSDKKRRNYLFKKCQFSGGIIKATSGVDVCFHFSGCVFEAAPSAIRWLASKGRTATFEDCTALSPEGQRIPITTLDELYAVFLPRKAKKIGSPNMR